MIPEALQVALRVAPDAETAAMLAGLVFAARACAVLLGLVFAMQVVDYFDLLDRWEHLADDAEDDE
jgi:hypothetical protein